MFAPKIVVAVLATMASIASAAPALTAEGTSFDLSNGNPVTQKDGCLLAVNSKHGGGVNAVIVLDPYKNCEDITTKESGPAGNGTAGVDFSLSPPGAFFIQRDYLAQCNITKMACKAAY